MNLKRKYGNYELHPKMKITGYENEIWDEKKEIIEELKRAVQEKQKEKKTCILSFDLYPGVRKEEMMELANALQPEYIGFVFAAKSKRAVSREMAAALKAQLSPQIQTVGVFVNEAPETVASLLNTGIIDIAQLHGQEDETYIQCLRKLTNKPLIQAFRVTDVASLANAQKSPADLILLDSGAGGTGTAFDWTVLDKFSRLYFLAGGLGPDTVGNAV